MVTPRRTAAAPSNRGRMGRGVTQKAAMPSSLRFVALTIVSVCPLAVIYTGDPLVVLIGLATIVSVVLTAAGMLQKTRK